MSGTHHRVLLVEEMLDNGSGKGDWAKNLQAAPRVCSHSKFVRTATLFQSDQDKTITSEDLLGCDGFG